MTLQTLLYDICCYTTFITFPFQRPRKCCHCGFIWSCFGSLIYSIFYLFFYLSICHFCFWFILVRYCYLKLLLYPNVYFICFFSPLLLILLTLIYLCGELSNPTSFCYGTIPVQDDAAPGTQEYIMLRQDSIHSADIRSKGSPFRAKCHEIFCCPLKQVVHKESSEPEGLFAPPSHFVTPSFSHLSLFSFPLYGLISFSASRLSLYSLLLYWAVSAVFQPCPQHVKLCSSVMACVCFIKTVGGNS